MKKPVIISGTQTENYNYLNTISQNSMFVENKFVKNVILSNCIS